MERVVPKCGRRYWTSRLGRDGPVPNGPRTCSYTISIPLAIAGSRPGAGWLSALSKTYRHLPFLPVAIWNPGKKTNSIKLTMQTCKTILPCRKCAAITLQEMCCSYRCWMLSVFCSNLQIFHRRAFIVGLINMYVSVAVNSLFKQNSYSGRTKI